MATSASSLSHLVCDAIAQTTSRPETLLHFVSSHLELKNSLEQAKAEMEEAFKAARAEARKKSGSQITKKDSAGNCNKPA